MSAWTNLNSREKLLLGLMLPLTIALIGYFYFYVPTRQSLLELRISVPKMAAEYAWMKNELALAEPWTKGNDNAVSAQPLLTVIERRAIDSDIKQAIQRVQPSGNNLVQIWFQDVNSDKWLRFIDSLAADGVVIESATVTRKSEGLVNIRSTLVR